MTDDDSDSDKSIKNKLKYYSYQNDHQYRAWKFIPGILGGEGGHVPTFPKRVQYKIFPKKFVQRHYPFRSTYQAEQKVKSRIEKIVNVSGGTRRFKKIHQQNFSERVDHKLLTKYHEDNHWCLERKYAPFILPDQPKREDIFSNDGFLLKEYRDTKTLQILLKQKNEKIKELRKKILNLKREKPKIKREHIFFRDTNGYLHDI